MYTCKTGVSFFVNCRPPTHFIIVAWLDLESKKKRWQIQEHWQTTKIAVWFFSIVIIFFLFNLTHYDMRQRWNRISDVSNERTRDRKNMLNKWRWSISRKGICHLSYNGGHLISSRHNFLINASSSSRHTLLMSMSDWKLSLLQDYD